MKETNIVWHHHRIAKEKHAQQKNQSPCIVWLTGLSGSGKSTIANALESKLYAMGYHTYVLDGDNVRHGLNCDLGFDDQSRIENIRRIGEVSKLFVDAGLIVITAFISPFFSDRQIARNLVEEAEFIEVFVDTPLNICEQRDIKGLYQKARRGEIASFTGISSPYEPPETSEMHLHTMMLSVEESVDKIVTYLRNNGYLHLHK